MVRTRLTVAERKVPRGLGPFLLELYYQVGDDWRRLPAPGPGEPTRSEKLEQRAIKQMFDQLGWVACLDTSQPFQAAITPGLPDLLCFDLRPTPYRLFFVETKARGAAQEPAQRLFEEMARRADIPYIMGGVTEVAAFLGLECASGS